MTDDGRVIAAAELEEMLRDDARGVRVTHGTTVSWGRLHGRPELAFVEPGIRDTPLYVRVVGELLPDAAIDETLTAERLTADGTVHWSGTFIVRDRQDDPGSGFTDLHLSGAPA